LLEGRYHPPVFQCAEVPDSDLIGMGRFVRESLIRDGSAAVTYPAALQPITVVFMASSRCPITFFAPADLQDRIVVAPVGFKTATFDRWMLPTSAEDCARSFGCNTHLGADLANLMIAVQDKESHHAHR